MGQDPVSQFPRPWSFEPLKREAALRSALQKLEAASLNISKLIHEEAAGSNSSPTIHQLISARAAVVRAIELTRKQLLI